MNSRLTEISTECTNTKQPTPKDIVKSEPKYSKTCKSIILAEIPQSKI